MEKENYRIAVNMLIEIIEYEIEGWEIGMTEEGDIEDIIKSIKRRIKVVRKFDS